MAQEFMVVSPELKEYQFIGNLGQAITEYDEEFALEQRLAVPVKPPTWSMREEAKLAAQKLLIIRMINYLTPKKRGPLTDITSTYNSQNRVRKANGSRQRTEQARREIHHGVVADPKAPVHPSTIVPLLNAGPSVSVHGHQRPNLIPTHQRTVCYHGYHLGKKCFVAYLSSLPDELIVMILRNASDAAIARLCTAYPYFAEMGRDILEDRHFKQLGTWAGKRLIVLGFCTEKGDYPEGVFEEHYQTADVAELEDDSVHDNDDEEMDEDNPLLNNILDQWKGDVDDVLLPEAFRMRRIPMETKAFMQNMKYTDTVRTMHSVFYPTDTVWMLRNHTTKEFVRADSLAHPADIRGPFITDGMGFGKVVMLRAAWSSDDDVGLPDYEDEEVHRGVWAGHMFDIVTLEMHEEYVRKHGGDWTDVGDAVADELRAVYASEQPDIADVAEWDAEEPGEDFDGDDDDFE